MQRLYSGIPKWFHRSCRAGLQPVSVIASRLYSLNLRLVGVCCWVVMHLQFRLLALNRKLADFGRGILTNLLSYDELFQVSNQQVAFHLITGCDRHSIQILIHDAACTLSHARTCFLLVLAASATCKAALNCGMLDIYTDDVVRLWRRRPLHYPRPVKRCASLIILCAAL